MELKNQNILFFSRSTQHGGTENIILQLCEALKPHVNKIVVATAGGFDVKSLERLNIKFYCIPDIEKKDLSTLIYVRKTIKSIIKKEQITVIHTHHRMAAFYCQLINSRGITLINTSHTVFYDKKILTQFAFKKMHLIACGDTVKKSLVDCQKIDTTRVTVISNAIKPFEGEINNISLIDSLKKDGYIVAGVIGRLSKEKGVINLVEAAKEFKNRKIRFVIVGTGDEEEIIKTKIKEYGLENSIILLGYRNDAQNVASQLDFLILPSLQEGLPLVPIEAFSVSTPVIATDVGGTSEVVIDGFNGKLIEAANNSELAKAIEYMMKENLTQYRKNAYQTYEEKFSYSIFKSNYINYYEKL